VTFGAFLSRVKPKNIKKLGDWVLVDNTLMYGGITLLHLIVKMQSLSNIILFLSKLNHGLRQSAARYLDYSSIEIEDLILVRQWVWSLFKQKSINYPLPNQFVDLQKTSIEEKSIHSAVRDGKTKNLYDLLNKQVDLNALDAEGISLWQVALTARPINCFVLLALLEGGVNPNNLGLDGQSLLHIAIKNEWSLDIIKMFFNLGLDVNVKNRAGITALSILLDEGYRQGAFYQSARVPNFSEKYAQFLLENGAGVNSTNKAGQTWREIAEKNNDVKRVKKLDEMLRSTDVAQSTETPGGPLGQPLLKTSQTSTPGANNQEHDVAKQVSSSNNTSSVLDNWRHFLFGRAAAAAAAVSASPVAPYGPQPNPKLNVTPVAPPEVDSVDSHQSAQPAFVYSQFGAAYTTEVRQQQLADLPSPPSNDPQPAPANNQRQMLRGSR
jgi:hypothetical protein